MDVLPYWRIDSCHLDIEGGANFHFKSRQPRLHAEIDTGETLWQFTRLAGRFGYRILACLVIRSKAINSLAWYTNLLDHVHMKCLVPAVMLVYIAWRRLCL